MSIQKKDLNAERNPKPNYEPHAPVIYPGQPMDDPDPQTLQSDLEELVEDNGVAESGGFYQSEPSLLPLYEHPPQTEPLMPRVITGVDSVLYHGSPTRGLKAFKTGKGTREFLHEGDGIYLTESADIARQYAGQEGSVYEVSIPSDQVFKTNRPSVLKLIRQVMKQYPEGAALESMTGFKETLDRIAMGDFSIYRLGEYLAEILMNDPLGEQILGSDDFYEKIAVFKKQVDAALSAYPIIRYRDNQLDKGASWFYVVRDPALIQIVGEKPVTASVTAKTKTKDDIKKQFGKTTSVLWHPVRIPGATGDEYHITVKFFGENEVTEAEIRELLGDLDTTPPSDLEWEPVEFTNKDGDQIQVLEITNIPDNLREAHEKLEPLKEDEYPTFRAHVTVEPELWKKVKEEKLQPRDLGVEIGPMELKVKGEIVARWKGDYVTAALTWTKTPTLWDGKNEQSQLIKMGDKTYAAEGPWVAWVAGHAFIQNPELKQQLDDILAKEPQSDALPVLFFQQNKDIALVEGNKFTTYQDSSDFNSFILSILLSRRERPSQVSIQLYEPASNRRYTVQEILKKTNR